MKTAFFDMDGTIVAPIFKNGQETVAGFPADEWIRYCKEKQEHTYDDCIVVQPVAAFAMRLKAADWDTKILTVTFSDGEKAAKCELITNKHLSDLFPEVICVSSDEEKIRYINKYVKSGQKAKDLILVEDRYDNALHAIALGIRGIHISHILTGTADSLAGLE